MSMIPVKSEATPMHRHDGVLRVDRDPYPHLRDDSGVVLARDYEQVEVMAFVCHAANSHSALLAQLEQRDAAITEACARLKALESQRDALANALEELLAARGTSLDIVGYHPVTNHPLSREGFAALNAEAALAGVTKVAK
jgi:hypothetical protein